VYTDFRISNNAKLYGNIGRSTSKTFKEADENEKYEVTIP
jgi:hypothetical protein